MTNCFVFSVLGSNMHLKKKKRPSSLNYYTIKKKNKNKQNFLLTFIINFVTPKNSSIHKFLLNLSLLKFCQAC